MFDLLQIKIYMIQNIVSVKNFGVYGLGSEMVGFQCPPFVSECGPGPSTFADRVLLTISTPKSINEIQKEKV
jgi:hypothetical protein